MNALVLWLALAGAAFAEQIPVYVDKSSVDAARTMEKVAGRDPLALKSEVELVDWARARLAWIALLRLQGREAEALKVFEGCGSYCGKYGPEKEWQAEKRWGCQKKREAIPCLLSCPGSIDTVGGVI